MKTLTRISLTCALLTASISAFGGSESPVVGQPAPALEIKAVSPEGKPIDLASLRGNVVVLEFWATWCGPCIKAQPHLEELAKSFSGKAVRFISASIEFDDPVAVQKYAQKHPMSSWVGIASRETIARYGVEAVPQTFVIDPTGKLAAITYPTSLTAEILTAVLEGKNRPDSVPSRPTTSPLSMPERKPAALSVEVFPTALKRSGGRFSDDGEWYVGGTDVPNLMTTVFRTTPARLKWEGESPKGYYGFPTQFPAAIGSDEMFSLLQATVPPAVGLRSSREKVEADVLVLRCLAGPSEELRKGSEPGHGSTGPGFSAGTSTRLKVLIAGLERDLNVPVEDETGLTGLYSWNLQYSAGDLDAAIKALKELGIEASRERRKVEVIKLKPLASGND